jgi:hypothetical protein
MALLAPQVLEVQMVLLVETEPQALQAHKVFKVQLDLLVFKEQLV